MNKIITKMTIKFPLNLLTLTLSILFLQSCSKDEQPIEMENVLTIENFIPEGQIDGVNFNPESGFAVTNSNDELIIVLSETEFTCDDLNLNNEPHITIKADNMVGDVPDSELVFWKDLSSGGIIERSTITIDSIGQNYVYGKLNNMADDANFIEGSFKVSYCQ